MKEVRNSEKYTPALRYHWLTRFYDGVIGHCMPENTFRSALLNQAAIQLEHRALDFGCGTGSLTLMAQEANPGAEIVGVDVDERALAIARGKGKSKGSAASFQKIAPGRLPFENQSFDRVLSCLVFHHLTREEKLTALAECRRVLRTDGEIHVADWGQPGSAILRAGFFLTQLLDGFETTDDNVRGHIPLLLRQAGFSDVFETGHFPTVFGSLRLVRGRSS